MDFDTQRKKRLEALEDRRKRLEEMKEKRKKSDISVNSTSTTSNTQDTAIEEEKNNVDELVKSLLSSSISDTNDIDTVNEIKSTDLVNSSNESKSISIKKSVNLSVVSKVSNFTMIPVLKPENYDKDTQTDTAEETLLMEDIDIDKESVFSSPLKQRSFRRNKINKNNTNNSSNNQISSPNKNLNNKLISDLDIPQINKNTNISIDANEVIKLPEFQNFIEKSSLIIERQINISKQYDILKNYREDNKSFKRLIDSHVIPLQVYDFLGTQQRPIMDIQFNSRYDELFLVSYGSKPKGVEDDSPGLVCIWSKVMTNRPEFVFTSPSPVITARFVDDDTNNHLIIGGCYNGQILLWDMRSKSLPIHRSRLASNGHKTPVVMMNLTSVNSSNSTSLVTSISEILSCSNDGTCCQWDISRLSEPVDVTNLPNINPSINIDNITESNDTNVLITISSLVFGFEDNIKYALYGTGSGHLLKLPYPYRNNDKIIQIEAHEGLITALDIHPSSRPLYHNLVLSSSLDWTIKLWHLQSTEKALFTFQAPSYDYVSDVKWCPTNPALFVAITSSGDIVFYHLSRSTTEHIEKISISKLVSDGIIPTSTNNSIAALNRILWSSDGKNILIGDAKGSIYSFEVQEQLLRMNSGDDSKFEAALLQSKGNSSNNSNIDPDVSILSDMDLL